MRVFNLTASPVTYRGIPIPPNGGSSEFPGLSVVPARDLELAEKRVLSFGSLPDWWMFRKKAETKKPEEQKQVPTRSAEEAASKGPETFSFRELRKRKK